MNASDLNAELVFEQPVPATSQLLPFFLELERLQCLPWLALALVLFRLRCSGLASSGSLV